MGKLLALAKKFTRQMKASIEFKNCKFWTNLKDYKQITKLTIRKENK